MRDLEIRGAGNLLGAGAVGPHRRGRASTSTARWSPRRSASSRASRSPEPVDITDRRARSTPTSRATTCSATTCAWRRTGGSPRSPIRVDVDDVRAEWEDRYGPPPPSAVALLDVARLRAECVRLGIRSITVQRNTARITGVSLQGVAEGAAPPARAEGGGQGRRAGRCRCTVPPADVATDAGRRCSHELAPAAAATQAVGSARASLRNAMSRRRSRSPSSPSSPCSPGAACRSWPSRAGGSRPRLRGQRHPGVAGDLDGQLGELADNRSSRSRKAQRRSGSGSTARSTRSAAAQVLDAQRSHDSSCATPAGAARASTVTDDDRAAAQRRSATERPRQYPRATSTLRRRRCRRRERARRRHRQPTRPQRVPRRAGPRRRRVRQSRGTALEPAQSACARRPGCARDRRARTHDDGGPGHRRRPRTRGRRPPPAGGACGARGRRRTRYARTLRHPAVDELGADGHDVHVVRRRLRRRGRSRVGVRARSSARLVAAAARARRGGVRGARQPCGRRAHGRAAARARSRVDVVLVPGVSFADLAWVRLGRRPDGRATRASSTAVPSTRAELAGRLLIAQCDNAFVLSDVKLALLEHLDPDTPVTVLQRLGLPDERVDAVPLDELDRGASYPTTSRRCSSTPAPVGRGARDGAAAPARQAAARTRAGARGTPSRRTTRSPATSSRRRTRWWRRSSGLAPMPAAYAAARGRARRPALPGRVPRGARGGGRRVHDGRRRPRHPRQARAPASARVRRRRRRRDRATSCATGSRSRRRRRARRRSSTASRPGCRRCSTRTSCSARPRRSASIPARSTRRSTASTPRSTGCAPDDADLEADLAQVLAAVGRRRARRRRRRRVRAARLGGRLPPPLRGHGAPRRRPRPRPRRPRPRRRRRPLARSRTPARPHLD